MKKEKRGTVALIVLDGWGYRTESKDNAIAVAKKPYFDHLWETYPHALLDASGRAVGLPDGQMGNSEVGHTTIGAGTVVPTELVRIDDAIASGEFEKNPAFGSLFEHVKAHNSMLHVQGLVGPGGVHAHSNHLFAFLRAAKNAGISKVAIHIFTDGRDTAPQSAADYIKELEEEIHHIGVGFIASVSGRFYAMDRDHNWDRTKRTEEAIFECKGNICRIKPSEYVRGLYQEGKLDEHLEPIVCLGDDGNGCSLKDNDGVFFFNFRADRARQISEKILGQATGKNICFVTLTEYKAEFKCLVAFPPIEIGETLASAISAAGLTQAHIAETEKFPHATYFLNGGREAPYPGEVHILLDSRKDVPTHDLAPKMRAEGIADKAVEEIKSGKDFIFINFANPDMVGHTANVPAIMEAIAEVDRQLERVVEALLAHNGVAFITADHGNAELNVDPVTGVKHTSHTLNPVPAIVTKTDIGLSPGSLADIAPTVLSLLAIPVPQSMTGKNLIHV